MSYQVPCIYNKKLCPSDLGHHFNIRASPTMSYQVPYIYNKKLCPSDLGHHFNITTPTICLIIVPYYLNNSIVELLLEGSEKEREERCVGM